MNVIQNTHDSPSVEFLSLTNMAFDSQANLRPETEQTASQYIQAATDGPRLSNYQSGAVALADMIVSHVNLDEPNPPSDQPSTSVQRRQTVLDLATTAESGLRYTIPAPERGLGQGNRAGTSKDRCAVCVSAYCERRHECPGRGGRERCRCNHPAIPSKKKIRISEAQIERVLAEKRREAEGS